MSSIAWCAWLTTSPVWAQAEAAAEAAPAAAPAAPAPAPAPVAPAPPAGTPAEAAAPGALPNAGAAPVAPPADPRESASLQPAPQAPHLGDGFHLFDRNYLMLGFNTQRVCQATSLELEASFVPWISDGLFWGGFYAAAGVQRSRTPPRKAPSETENCFEGEELESRDDVDAWKGRDYIRYKYDPRTHQGGDGVRLGAGGEFGWRFLGLDVGYLHSTALVGHDHGMRMRVGISLADELFTGGMVKYAKSCCLDAQGCPDLNSVVPCECARTPVGISLFLYYGAEVYWRNGAPDPETRFWSDSMFGLSLKVAIGTPAWWGPR